MENIPSASVVVPPSAGGGSLLPKAALLIAGMVVGGVGVWLFVPRGSLPESTETPSPSVSMSPTPMSSATPPTQAELETIFGLADKVADTKIYYSEKLGVGLTYLPNQDVQTVQESGNVINVGGQTVEVFYKDPTDTIQLAISKQFLYGYDPAMCYITGGTLFGVFPQNHKPYIIDYPESGDPDNPSWINPPCPATYSKTNAVTYFLYNTDTPGKYVFISVGQDSAASDGTIPGIQGGYNWSQSVRILR